MKTFTIAAVIVILGFWTVLNYQDAQRPVRSYAAPVQIVRTPPAVTVHEVVYKITTGDYGSQNIEVTYEMPSGTAQKTVCICRHAKTAVVDTRTAMSGEFVYLSAQNDETNSPILCEIYVDGLLTHQVKSFGPYKIASCSGTIP